MAKKKKILLITAALFVLFSSAFAYAFLRNPTPTVHNTFDAPQGDITIEEEFDGTEKKNVSIKNTSNFPVYIRAAVVINSENSETGEIAEATGDIEYEISDNWFLADDGYYYYKKIVPAGESTDNLIKNAISNGSEFVGYTLAIDVQAQAIQASPEEAAETAWGVTITDKILSK